MEAKKVPILHEDGFSPPYVPYGPVRRRGMASLPYRPRRGMFRRGRALKLVALACLVFIALAQWKQLRPSRPAAPAPAPRRSAPLSAQRLRENQATCARLRRKPEDPPGGGRDKSARYVEGHEPTLIRNATVWTGEPVSKDDAASMGEVAFDWIKADVLVERGLITKVEPGIELGSLASDTLVWDAKGRQLTAGLVDMHSHMGVFSLPVLNGRVDTNELTSPITPYVRSIDGFYPLDHQIQVIKSGGVTTSLVLPGSGNNIGGEAYLLKHAVGKRDGRDEIGPLEMLADPDRTWRYMKMACGENPKGVYGRQIGGSPFTRMGESWEFRHAFEQAAALVRSQDDWCDAADAVGAESMPDYLPEELRWETLGAALRGQVLINTHCYTIPDLEAFVDHTNEFNFSVRAFHHAHETYLVPEILKRAYGDIPPASALFADNMYYKAEAYEGSVFAGKILHDNGLVPIYVSDNPVLNAQHLVLESAKAYRYGLPYHVAMAAVTTAPAFYTGMGNRLGKIKPGFDADIVVWDSDPLQLGAAPVQVWVDGTAQFEDPVELEKPPSKPLVPDLKLGDILDDAVQMNDVVFTGIQSVYYRDTEMATSDDEATMAVVVRDGKVICTG